ncbi:MAG: acetoin:2,6-dichlorophenolindophenol oxidoreductase subunit alpha [Thermoanaerobacteraceae bacterium]|jgi:pyruvate dehydrogenase E1 component alpha subunit|nr:acetoin:2,6-dichlorophenolindophenol oxidoreductase subunit alpha [Thermoanaerobacteraceae bacterium]
MEISKELGLNMYKKMLEIRKFEEKAIEFFTQNLIRGSMHLYIGEEAVAVGVCSALNRDDYIVSTHRGHGHCIAKGADLDKMMAELLGKATGYCKGKGGSMHIADVESGNLGANGIVGGGIPIAVGAALSSKLQKLNRVSVSFFSDGASNQGTFHESINLASIWKLPIIFVCENNFYGITMPVKESTSVEKISERAKAYSIPGITIDGNNVLEVYQTALEAVERARKGEGPTLIEAITYRWEGHYKGDPQVYRSKEEIDEWKEKDPIKRFRELLFAENILDEDMDAQIIKEVQEEIQNASDYALRSPNPSPQDLLNDVYANPL